MSNDSPRQASQSLQCPLSGNPGTLIRAVNRMVDPLDQILVHLRNSAVMHRVSVLLMAVATALLFGTAYHQTRLATALEQQEQRLEQVIQATTETRAQVEQTKHQVEQTERMVEAQPQVRIVEDSEGGGPAAVLVVKEDPPRLESRDPASATSADEKAVVVPIAKPQRKAAPKHQAP